MAKPTLDQSRRARAAIDAAGAGHELERIMLSISESLRRGEEPDPMMLGAAAPVLERLTALVGMALPKDASE